MNQDFHFIVARDQADIRLDKLLCSRLLEQNISRSVVRDWIKAGRVKVDGSPRLKPSAQVQPGQTIEVRPGPSGQEPPKPVKGLLNIVYNDDYLLVLNKQPGLNVHPAPSVREPTLVHYLLAEYPALKKFARQDRAGIVHRLDRDTSGLMLAALDPETASRLQDMFQKRRMKKVYLALLCGCPDKKHDLINLPLGRDPETRTRMTVLNSGRAARTQYRIVYEAGDKSWSLALIRIFTGRTHQIRVHLASIGHPVVGDTVYGSQALDRIKKRHPGLGRLVHRQLLHSTRLEFIHPRTRAQVEFFQPMPADFQRVILHLTRQCQRIIITGSMGSGKSMVASMLRELGHPVFDSDQCVRKLYQPGQDGWELIRKRFGDVFFDPDTGQVNKTLLLQKIVDDPGILEELNHLIHPLVSRRLEAFFEHHADSRTACAEIPLAFETSMSSAAGLVVGVFCPDSMRMARLQRFRQKNPHYYKVLESTQLSQPEKIRRCHLVLDNSGDMACLKDRVVRLDKLLRNLRRKRLKMLFNQIRMLVSAPF